MEESIGMTRKETCRLVVLENVRSGVFTLKSGAEVLCGYVPAMRNAR